MLSIDYRVGSIELEPLFRPYGIRLNKTKLDFGDFCWSGNGPKGECLIAVERKRITDLIQSIQSKRLTGHQLPGMAETYDYCYLIVEGLWRPGDNGELEIRNGKWSTHYSHSLPYRSIDNYLASLELQAGVIYRRTITAKETVAMIVDLYRYWTDKQWKEHKSHKAVYAPANGGEGRRFSFLPRKISLVEKIALQLPGIGDDKAQLVAKKFKNVLSMIHAQEDEWTQIQGIGSGTARKIIDALKSYH